MFDLEKTLQQPDSDEEYTVRSMTGREQMSLYRGLTPMQDIPTDRMFDLLEACLLGWDKAKNLRGEPMGDFSKDKIEYLHAMVVDWLVSEIMVLSAPNLEEKKPSPVSQSSEITETNSDAGNASA